MGWICDKKHLQDLSGRYLRPGHTIYSLQPNMTMVSGTRACNLYFQQTISENYASPPAGRELVTINITFFRPDSNNLIISFQCNVDKQQ